MNRQGYSAIGKGLWLLFLGGVLGLTGSFLPNLEGILSLAALVLELLGLHTAGRGDSGYRTAFSLTLANLAVQFLAGMLSVLADGVLWTLLNLAGAALSFLAVYYVCAATARLLENRDASLARRGVLVWKISAGGFGVLAVCAVLSLVPLINLLAGLAAIAIALVQAVTLIVYLDFLYQASNVFRNW